MTPGGRRGIAESGDRAGNEKEAEDVGGRAVVVGGIQYQGHVVANNIYRMTLPTLCVAILHARVNNSERL